MNWNGPTQCTTNLVVCPRVGKHAGTDTIEFIFNKYKPKDTRAAYVIAVCKIRPQKTETYRTILTTGGNIIDYPG